MCPNFVYACCVRFPGLRHRRPARIIVKDSTYLRSQTGQTPKNGKVLEIFSHIWLAASYTVDGTPPLWWYLEYMLGASYGNATSRRSLSTGRRLISWELGFLRIGLLRSHGVTSKCLCLSPSRGHNLSEFCGQLTELARHRKQYRTVM